MLFVVVASAACAGVLGLRRDRRRTRSSTARTCSRGSTASSATPASSLPGDGARCTFPTDADCRRCHEKPHDDRPCIGATASRTCGRRRELARAQLRFEHPKHMVAARGDCVRCHAEVAEARPEAVLPKMATCFGCHEHRDQWTLRDCDGCHVDLPDGGAPPDDHLVHDGDFDPRARRRARRARATSARAATPSGSAPSCHGEGTVPALPWKLAFDDVSLSGLHRAGFAARHADEARADPGLCTTCHTESSCVDCHTRENVAPGSTTRSPHPPGWCERRGHGVQARIDPASCAGCHGGAGEQLCVGCHSVGGPGGNPHGPGFASRKDEHHDLPCRLCHGVGRDEALPTRAGERRGRRRHSRRGGRRTRAVLAARASRRPAASCPGVVGRVPHEPGASHPCGAAERRLRRLPRLRARRIQEPRNRGVREVPRKRRRRGPPGRDGRRGHGLLDVPFVRPRPTGADVHRLPCAAPGPFAAIAQHATTDCTKCHRVHESPSIVPADCNGCHTERAVRHGEHTGSSGCLDCHRAHAPRLLPSTRVLRAMRRPRDRTRPATNRASAATSRTISSRGGAGVHPMPRREVDAGGRRRAGARRLHELPHAARARRGRRLLRRMPRDGACRARNPGTLRRLPCAARRRPAPIAAACTSCHAQIAAVDTAAHAGGIACEACHKPHAFAMPDPRAVCVTCHARETSLVSTNPGHQDCASCHGTALAHAPAKALACESCHAKEQASAPSGHQSCQECHDPHAGLPAPACASCHKSEATGVHAVGPRRLRDVPSPARTRRRRIPPVVRDVPRAFDPARAALRRGPRPVCELPRGAPRAAPCRSGHVHRKLPHRQARPSAASHGLQRVPRLSEIENSAVSAPIRRSRRCAAPTRQTQSWACRSLRGIPRRRGNRRDCSPSKRCAGTAGSRGTRRTCAWAPEVSVHTGAAAGSAKFAP